MIIYGEYRDNRVGDLLDWGNVRKEVADLMRETVFGLERFLRGAAS